MYDIPKISSEYLLDGYVVYVQANELDDRLGELTCCSCVCISEMWSGRRPMKRARSEVAGRIYNIYKVDGRGLGHGCQTYQVMLSGTTPNCTLKYLTGLI